MFDEYEFYRGLLLAWFVLAAGAFFLLLVKTAPYGRFFRPGWGPGIGCRLGWMLIESPALFVFAMLFLLGGRFDPVSIAFCALWSIHYGYRSFIYPARIRSRKRMALFVLLSGIAFSCTNGYLQARYLFTISMPYSADWLTGPRFLIGLVLFATGWAMNLWSDNALRKLRATDSREYAIPRGGLFEWVSCPNYLGEIIEWTGWALLTWSLRGLAFAFWTAANLVPRALAYHRWYRKHFTDYPKGRKAIIPGVL